MNPQVQKHMDLDSFDSRGSRIQDLGKTEGDACQIRWSEVQGRPLRAS